MSENIFDHIAYASTQTDKSLEIFSILGFKEPLFYKQKIDKFDSYITKIKSESGQIIEIVEPCSKLSVVNNVLQDRDATIYHSAFFTHNLINTLKLLQAAGAVIITEPQSIPFPVTKAHVQYKTSHVYHSNMGLFEVTGPIIGNI